MKHIAVVDADAGSRNALERTLAGEYLVTAAETLADAVPALAERPADLLLFDPGMPGAEGLALLAHTVGRLYPDLPVVLLGAARSGQEVPAGARDTVAGWVPTPCGCSAIRDAVARALAARALQREAQALRGDLARAGLGLELVGSSPALRAAVEQVRRAAGADTAVLIAGERGTGCEALARQLHAWGAPAGEPFVVVPCGLEPPERLEEALFGDDGAGGAGLLRGLMDAAGSGTLFFDEVALLPAALQARLERLLAERIYRRKGGTCALRSAARVVAATSRDLAGHVAAGAFRQDLCDRLAFCAVRVPPLRERLDDLPALAQHCVDACRQRLHAAVRGLDADALDLLRRQAWPGNVRELWNWVERAVLLHPDEVVLRAAHFAPGFVARTGETLAHAVQQVESAMIRDALGRTQGVQTYAARQLGTTRRILRYKMDKLGIGGDACPDAAADAAAEDRLASATGDAP